MEVKEFAASEQGRQLRECDQGKHGKQELLIKVCYAYLRSAFSIDKDAKNLASVHWCQIESWKQSFG